MSHELRTPLTSIRLFSETLALRRGDTAAEDKCIAGLALESARLQELIDRLLEWGRMESGNRQYRMSETDIYAIVQAAVDACEPMRERRKAQIDVEMPEGLPPIIGERGALSDAGVNLLTNAHKYGGEPPEIQVKVCTLDKYICISVTDNGPGIDEREHKRIFQKFYRVDDRLSRDKEGSGLGLAIVNHVVGAHRGGVDVQSELGAWTTFRILIPVASDLARSSVAEKISEAAHG